MHILYAKKRGMSLVEALVFSMIFVIVSSSFYRTFNGGLKVIRDAKARIAATQVLNENFEVLRNLPYEDIGTTGGSPLGDLLQEKTVERSGVTFKVTTNIMYADDDYDGFGTSDEKPNDYKHVGIEVEWDLGGDTKKIQMASRITPPGTEELYTGGILDINIHQTNGTPVQGAHVLVKNILTNAVVRESDTLGDGRVYIIGLTPGNRIYSIEVTKNGYESVSTMPPYNTTAYDPVDEHSSVVLAGIWPQTVIFDQYSTLHLRTVNPLGNSVGGIDFSLEGGRKLGDTVPDALPVYSYVKQDHSTNSSGEFDLEQHSPGKYIFEYRDTANNSNYVFWKISPYFANTYNNFFANPGQINSISAIIIPKNVPSLFLTVTDAVDGTPISNVEIKLKNQALSYEQTSNTDQYGKVYFPTSSGSLQNTQYEIVSQATGYQDKSQMVDINNLTQVTLQITHT